MVSYELYSDSVFIMKESFWFYSFLSITGFGCSDPFAVDRHDLLSPRVLGVRSSDSGHFVQVWNGEGPWHVEAPVVSWYDSNGVKLGDSVHLPSVEEHPTSLIYTDPKGDDHFVQFDLYSSTFKLQPLFYDLGTITEFDLDSRLENIGEPWTGGVVPEALRIEFQEDEFSDNGRMRWMSGYGRGTFLEIGALSTDYFQSDIVMDRDEVLQNVPQNFEYSSVFALYVDGLGENQWTWMDLWYSDIRTIEIAGRKLPINGDLSDDWSDENAAFVLNKTDNEFGWSLTPTDDAVTPLSCAIGDGPFEWMWIETGLCTISDVDGQIVLLEIQ